MNREIRNSKSEIRTTIRRGWAPIKQAVWRSCLRLGLQLPALGLLVAFNAHAQWQEQSFTLKPGWNAVFLHVDASHEVLDNLITGAANPIAEVWRWQPPATTLQFTTTPQEPSAPNTQWAVWDRRPAVVDSLVRLGGNAAYLVRNTNTTDYVWSVIGRPVPPRYDWTTTGLNFIGFSTPTNAPPNFDTFLLPAPEFRFRAEIYRYVGGDLGATNPVRVFDPLFRTTLVNRGEAYWIRAGTEYNRYFGPVEIRLQNPSGVAFADTLGSYRIRLKNLTTSNRVMSVSVLASGTPPAGQPAIAGVTPLLVRGSLNTTNLTYAHTNLSTPQNFSLAPQGQPGSEREVVIGLDRSAMTQPAGSLYAGILRLADTAGLSQTDIPVSATVANTAGLWVGAATITQVAQYLKTYQRDTNGQPVLGPVTTNGAAYIATATNTALTATAQPVQLRLIMHNDATGTNAGLLQRVFYGMSPATNFILTTSESLLDASRLVTARRISAAHLPWTPTNTVWKFSGQLLPGSTLSATVDTPYDSQAANPFLHTFHPDHDNLGTDFKTKLNPGFESYGISRLITLVVTPPASDFASLTRGNLALTGIYTETITVSGKITDQGTELRRFDTRGVFSLNRISEISLLTTP